VATTLRAVRTCPTCGRENPDANLFCQFCGRDLLPAVSAPVATGGEYQISHRGTVYGVGYGPTFYGVWDLRVGGSPLAWFEKSPAGWESAWHRYQHLETGGGQPTWRKASVGWILLHLLIAAAIWFGQILVLAMILGATGRATNLDNLPQANQEAIGVPVLLTMATTLLGWYLFVYLKTSVAARAAALLIPLAGGFTVLVLVTLDNVPTV
jgi:hypothetical protein